MFGPPARVLPLAAAIFDPLLSIPCRAAQCRFKRWRRLSRTQGTFRPKTSETPRVIGSCTSTRLAAVSRGRGRATQLLASPAWRQSGVLREGGAAAGIFVGVAAAGLLDRTLRYPAAGLSDGDELGRGAAD